MSSIPSIELLVFPVDCDSFGHVNQATFLRLFEQARWQAVAQGPGVDIFQRHDAWPAVRKTTIEYHASAFPGDLIRFDISVTNIGRTSIGMHQTARRSSDNQLLAEADFLFVCVASDGTPTPVPEEVKAFLGKRPSPRPSGVQQMLIRGLTTGIEVQGDGNAVLFVHGFPLDRTMWRDLMGTLTGWKRIAPDLRGLGTSDGPESGYSMQEYADDCAAVLDALGVETAIVCGLSMGGYVAFELLRRHRSRVKALMLLNTRAEADDSESRRKRNEMGAAVRKEGVGVLEDLMIHRLLAPGSVDTMPHLVDRLKGMINGHSADGIVGALEAMKNRVDSTDLLPQIDVPTLVVAGREDGLVSLESSQSMAVGVPGAQFTVINGAGHLTPLEQPIATGRVIREFLESIS